MKLQSKNLQITENQSFHFLHPAEISPNKHPIIFLHGFTGSSSDWLTIAESLDDRFYPIIPDLPGHGKTEVSTNYFTTNGQIELLLRLLNYLNIEKVFLAGYSMGGRLALQFSVMYPDRVNGLVLENSTPGISAEEERVQRVESDQKIIERIEKSSPEDFLNFWLSLPIFDSLSKNRAIKISELIQSRAKQINKSGLQNSLRYFGTGVMPHCIDKLKILKNIPVLLLGGKYDLKYYQILNSIHLEIKSSIFHTIKDAGHNIHLENPADFIKLLNRFLIDNC